MTSQSSSMSLRRLISSTTTSCTVNNSLGCRLFNVSASLAVFTRNGSTNGRALGRTTTSISSRSIRSFGSSSKWSSSSDDSVVSLQLDYYLSPQFAGVASAMVNDTYQAYGIDLKLLPTCPVGLEQRRVRDSYDTSGGGVVLGTVEQNVFVPNLMKDPSLHTKAVAAMFHQSPLCVASILGKEEESNNTRTIGAHEDTVDLLQHLFPNDKVIASERATKTTDLQNPGVLMDAIQAYTTTEVPTLERLLDDQQQMNVTPLEGMSSSHGTARLGYSQMMFAPREVLQDDRRAIVQAFLAATFEGWSNVIRHPEQAAELVEEARKMVGQNEANDHWVNDDDYRMEMTRRCSNLVKSTFQGDRYGVIDPVRWKEATEWIETMHSSMHPETSFSGLPKDAALDATIWQPSHQLLGGTQLSHRILADAKASATLFEATCDRKPSLAVITVGDLARYQDAARRLDLYSDVSRSWFSKTETGQANHFDVTELTLDASTTTTETLLSELTALQKDVDGIQLMWPLPDHIDAVRVYNAIHLSKDVDGIHFVGQQEVGNKSAYAPVTPAAVMALMDDFDVVLEGKKVVVIGCSPIVGSPLAYMCRQQGAAVTIVQSKVPVDTLEKAVGDADVILCCAGEPGLIPAEWIHGGTVINVGSTFVADVDGLVSDVAGDIAAHADRYSPVPGGIGPLSAPMLFKNVAQAAWDQMHSGTGHTKKLNGWNHQPESLKKTYHFDTYKEALEAARKVDEMSTVMDHHANMKLVHECVHGVDLELEFFTWEANQLTDKDYGAAMAMDMLLSEELIQMSNYAYYLKEESIAKYPASPRGSSKVLQTDMNGNVIYHDNFAKALPSLAKGCHLVLNETLVLDARLFVTSDNLNNGKKTEMMILDLGDVDVTSKCADTLLRVMIRSNHVEEGSTLLELEGGKSVLVEQRIGQWLEDEKSDGNGTEAWVRIQADHISIEDYLNLAGSVPIPPYFHREAEESDQKSYNNIYAKANQAGSVAAPTAGLHFTKNVLTEVGEENISYLTLHVGAGTFKPVLVDDARDHDMHAEAFTVSVKELKNIIQALENGKPLIVVGTTSARTLESLFWCGVKKLQGHNDASVNGKEDALLLDKLEWIPLLAGPGRAISNVSALKALVADHEQKHGSSGNEYLHGKTSLMICPPMYEFQVVDHLITNFHAPDSTLMLLVSGFLKDANGKKIRHLYETAQANGYRFLSYGDVCFFSKPGSQSRHL